MQHDSEIRSFQEECADLARLETFDTRAFQADDHASQELCNFILSLALIYNDCKDVMYAQITLEQSRPSGPYRKTRAWGAYAGIEFHTFRAIISLLHELFDLIRDNRKLLDHPFFQTVARQLHPRERDAWNTVVTVGLGATPSDALGRSLMLIRNKVSSHYDPKAIFAGYRCHFVGRDKKDERAFISRGTNMSESRFYFADAAARSYLSAVVGTDKADALLKNVAELLRPVNHALMGIVDKYVQKRGFAYRPFTE